MDIKIVIGAQYGDEGKGRTVDYFTRECKNGDMAVRAAEGMSSDVSSVMNSLADDMKTALPTDFSIDGNVKNSVNTQGLNSGVGGLSLVLNIANFNNYSNDDISQLTNEIMETAGQFAKRKGLVFA